MKYISAEKLIAEIKGIIAAVKVKKHPDEFGGIGQCLAAAEIEALNLALDCIKELQQEQPEVDLKKELYRWRHKHFKGKRDGDYNGEYLERESQLDLARHFYELGLNARKL